MSSRARPRPAFFVVLACSAHSTASHSTRAHPRWSVRLSEEIPHGDPRAMPDVQLQNHAAIKRLERRFTVA